MVTSEPVRDRMVAFTRSISAATSPTSASIEAVARLSKGTITATLVSTFAQFAVSSLDNRKSRRTRQGHDLVDSSPAAAIWAHKGRPKLRELVRQRYSSCFGHWRAAGWRKYPSSGARSEHEHH